MPAERPERKVALGTLVVGAVALAVLVVVLVPFDPVPGGRLTPAPVATVFTPAQVERAEDYARWARLWSWASLLVSLAVACWFGFTTRGRRLVERLPGRWWLQVPLAVVVLALIGRLVTLPAAVALQQLRRDNGLSEQAWRAWGVDLLKGELVTAVMTALGVLVLVACARRFTRAWPAVVGGLLAVLVVLGSFVYPVLVEPVFNDFEPLPDGALRSEILALADREGVEVDDVLVADASRRTTTLNAYVSGFGSTRRIVVYDNLVNGVPDNQILAVVAHELAHARHDDVMVGTALGAAGSLVGVGLLGLVLGRLRRRGHPGAGEAAVVPLVLALVAIGTLAGAPAQNAVSRQIETRADVDALRYTDDPTAFVSVQRQLAIRSLADPTPPAFVQLWFGSHPTTLTRIALVQRMAETG